jgi:hypothetical protein
MKMTSPPFAISSMIGCGGTVLTKNVFKQRPEWKRLKYLQIKLSVYMRKIRMKFLLLKCILRIFYPQKLHYYQLKQNINLFLSWQVI